MKPTICFSIVLPSPPKTSKSREEILFSFWTWHIQTQTIKIRRRKKLDVVSAQCTPTPEHSSYGNVIKVKAI
jgi:hypothetical protein